MSLAAAAAAASASPRPFALHLLCMPAASMGGALMPPPDSDDAAGGGEATAHEQWEAMRALLRRAVGEESLAISHVVCTSSDGLSSALISLVQSNLASAGLPRAETFHASGAAPSPEHMIKEMMDACNNALGGDDAAAEAAASSDASAPPTVSSPAFRRSIAATRVPRILLLAPSAELAFNHALHRGILALDTHAHRAELNGSKAHCYSANAAAAAMGGTVPVKPQSQTASAAASTAAAAAAISPLQHAPLVPRDSSVFGLDLVAPVLLEYVLHRSVVSNVWSDVHRLQAEIETPGRASTEAEAPTPTDPTLKLSTYPDPRSSAADGSHSHSHSLAALTMVAKHTRIFTALSVHKLQSIVLLHIELEEDAEKTTGEADKAASAAAQPLSRSERSAQLAARNATAISNAIASLGSLRVLSAFCSARQVLFDDSDAGRKLASALEQQQPQFGFRPVFLPFARAMDLYAFCIGEGSGSSGNGSASCIASELILCGSKADLAPLLSLLLNGGRRHHLRLCASVVSAAWDTLGSAIEVQHVTPEIPSALLRDSPLADEGDGETSAEGNEADSESIVAQLCSSRFHGSRVLNGSFVPLAAAAQSDASEMANFFFHLEVIVLEFFCGWLSLLMMSLFLSYRCTPFSRCSPIKMRITQYCCPALILLIIRCLDPSTQLRRIPWHVQAIFSDQVTALISHAAMLVLLASARSLYTMIRRPVPRPLPYLIFVPAIIYQLVALAVGIANIWVLPDALMTLPTSRVMNQQAIRIFNFQVLMIFICVASWACVIGLRKQVAIYAVAIEKQEADRAANTAATLAAASAAAAATTAAASIPSPSHAGGANKTAAIAPPAAAASLLKVVVVPSALTVGAGGGSISVPAPSASSVGGGAYSVHGAGNTGNQPSAAVAAVVSSAAINASAALQRLTDLKDAARKLRTLFILIQCVIWLGFGTNMSFLSFYLRGEIDPYYNKTDFNDNETYKVSLAALPMYAIGHIAACAVMLWYVWLDSNTWRKHLSEGGLAELLALVWRGAQEEGHTNQTRQSQLTAPGGGAAGDRRVHPAPIPSALGAKSAWANLEVSTALGNAAAPAASSQKRLTGGGGGGRNSSKRGSGGHPYLVTSPTAAATTMRGVASPGAVSSPMDVVSAADLVSSGASSPVAGPDGSDDAVVMLHQYPSGGHDHEHETGIEGEEEA